MKSKSNLKSVELVLKVEVKGNPTENDNAFLDALSDKLNAAMIKECLKYEVDMHMGSKNQSKTANYVN
jgi:hypothetical protein